MQKKLFKPKIREERIRLITEIGRINTPGEWFGSIFREIFYQISFKIFLSYNSMNNFDHWNWVIKYQKNKSQRAEAFFYRGKYYRHKRKFQWALEDFQQAQQDWKYSLHDGEIRYFHLLINHINFDEIWLFPSPNQSFNSKCSFDSDRFWSIWSPFDQLLINSDQIHQFSSVMINFN